MDEASKLYRNLEDFFQAGSYVEAREAVTKLKVQWYSFSLAIISCSYYWMEASMRPSPPCFLVARYPACG